MTLLYTKNPIVGTVNDIKPVEIKMIYNTEYEYLWDELVSKYHYLSYRKMLGARLKYLVYSGSSLIAAIGFRSASLKLKSRDDYIGWTVEQRKKHLMQVASNNRFLILPWVKVKNLGSYLLARVIRHVSVDWEYRYGERLLLLETFVDSRYHLGTVYKAANWIHVGKTQGFTRQGVKYIYHGNPKEVYLYPLKKDFRQIIGCQQQTQTKQAKKHLCVRPFLNYKERRDLAVLLNRIDWDPNITTDLSIDKKDVLSLNDKLINFILNFKSYFQKSPQVTNALIYIKGLASNLNAKSIEPIAIEFEGPSKVRGMQHFMSNSPWDEDGLLQASSSEALKLIAMPDGMITLDSSEFPKKGKESAGVAHQYCGNTGKKDNCQSGVFIGYVSDKGYSLLNRKLYMPEKWFDDEYEERRTKTKVPTDLTFQTKSEIALEMLEATEKYNNFTAQWFGMDSFFGRNSSLRDLIGERYYYFADIPSNTQVWLDMPEIGLPQYKGRGKYPTKKIPLIPSTSVSDIAKDLNLEWKTVNFGEGAKGPILSNIVTLRVFENRDGMPGSELWLFIRKNTDGEIKYSFSNAPANISDEELVRVSCYRWTIEQLFQEGKSFLGMDHYELRSYPGWHKHMSIVILVMHFFLSMRLEFSEKKLHYTSNSCQAVDIGINQ